MSDKSKLIVDNEVGHIGGKPAEPQIAGGGVETGIQRTHAVGMGVALEERQERP